MITSIANKKALILQAAEAMKIIAKVKGTVQQTHCILENGLAKITDGNLSIGYPVGTDISFVTEVSKLFELAKSVKPEDKITFTMQDSENLLAINGDIKLALIGEDRNLVKAGVPDAIIAPATDRLRFAFELASKVLLPKGVEAYERNAFSNGGVLTATDSKLALEAFHGVDLPPNITFSVPHMKAVLKIKSPISGFGYSNLSTTIHFENGAYVKGLTEAATVPSVKMWDEFPSDWLNADEFLKAVAAISKFSELGFVRIDLDKIEAFESDSHIANFDTKAYKHMPEGESYSAAEIAKLAKFVKFVGFGVDNKCLYLTDNVSFRALTTKVEKRKPVLYNPDIERAIEFAKDN